MTEQAAIELALQPEPAVAWVFGQPVADIPKDLFIPPEALQVILQNFEGPLDLLLYLIRKQNLDILDIPIAAITEQYLGYIAQLDSAHFDLAAEYLLMAAVLIEIKSRMLLPPKAKEGEDEAADPRAELVRRLLEYEKMKLAAQQINALPHHGRDFVQAQVLIEQSLPQRFPDVDVAELQAAWRDIVRRAKLVQHHHISREALSVREYMSRVLKQLQGQRFVPFEAVFAPEQGSAVLVVTFIALLELAKESLLEITQAEAFAPIYLRLTYSSALPVQALKTVEAN